MLEKTIKILDGIVELSIYCLIFIIPFSKAGIEIFATLAIGGWILKKVAGCRLQVAGYFPKTPLNKPIFVFFVVSVASMFFSVDIDLSLEGVFLKLAEYLLIFFVCIDTFLRNNRRFGILLVVVMASVTILFADAGFQWITGKDFIRGFTPERLRASFSSANDFAGYIIAILPVLFCIVFISFKNKKELIRLAVRFGSLVLFLAGLIYLSKTLARGAWLGYLVSIGFLAVAGFLLAGKARKKFAIAAALCIFIPLVAVLGFARPIKGRLVSVKEGFRASLSRLHQWKEAISIIEDFPILGAGPNTYAMIIPNYNLSKTAGGYPHNSYLHMAAETGILGLTVFLWALWRFFGMGLRSLLGVKRNGLAPGNDSILPLAIMAGVLATLVQSFFDTNLYALRLVILFWIMLGIGTAQMVLLGGDKHFSNQVRSAKSSLNSNLVRKMSV